MRILQNVGNFLVDRSRFQVGIFFQLCGCIVSVAGVDTDDNNSEDDRVNDFDEDFIPVGMYLIPELFA